MSKAEPCADSDICPARRLFLKTTATGVATMLLSELFPGRVLGQDPDREVNVASYPRVAVAKVSELKQDEPVDFFFPSNQLHTGCVLVKLGRQAGGGVGPDQDIVAFSTMCTHMGNDMMDGYVAEHKVIGCDAHLSTFDLTRHGILVAGHATASLPQIVLEIEDDTVYATAIAGLIYGYNQNPPAENA